MYRKVAIYSNISKTRLICRRVGSVCASITCVYSIETNEHILFSNFFHHIVAPSFSCLIPNVMALRRRGPL